jgi:hypothetical protein
VGQRLESIEASLRHVSDGLLQVSQQIGTLTAEVSKLRSGETASSRSSLTTAVSLAIGVIFGAVIEMLLHRLGVRP